MSEELINMLKGREEQGGVFPIDGIHVSRSESRKNLRKTKLQALAFSNKTLILEE